VSPLPRHEELLLLAHITGRTRTELLLNSPNDLPEEQLRAFFHAAERRRVGEPLQYILGAWDFYGRMFKVDARALIPRPETELLVEKVVNYASKNAPSPCRVLDVCTGSGCIAISLLLELEAKGLAVEMTATDISPDALALARENAALHNTAERVRFVETDLAAGVGGMFDIIVSNPPYIPVAEMAVLQAEVRDHEPHMALVGGADGMDLYRRLLPQAHGLLSPGGALFMEIGPRGVGELVEKAGFCEAMVLDDYAGLTRMVTARR